MLDAYIQLVEQVCEKDIVCEIRSIDFQQPDEKKSIHKIYQTLSKQGAYPCLAAYVGYMSYHITQDTPDEIIHRFIAIAGAVEEKIALKQAMQRVYGIIEYPTPSHKLYFSRAGLYRLDLDPLIHERFSTSFFTNDTEEAHSYYTYLTLIGDPRGVDKFNAVLKQVEEDAHTLMGILSSLGDITQDLATERRNYTGVLKIMQRYKDDVRRAIGVNGPGTGASIQEVVQPILDIYAKPR